MPQDPMAGVAFPIEPIPSEQWNNVVGRADVSEGNLKKSRTAVTVQDSCEISRV